MAVFRIEKTRDYTVMANRHLRNTSLQLKAKGLLSLMLSLPEDWDYTTKGLAKICKDGVDSICFALSELEAQGYVIRERIRNPKGQLTDIQYPILEHPVLPLPRQEKPKQENPAQLNPKKSSIHLSKKDLLSAEVSNPLEDEDMPQGADISAKVLNLSSGFGAAFQNVLPSLHPSDILAGIAGVVIIRLGVYFKGKNAKKYRKGMKYGSARWGTPEDIKPYIDPVFENNELLT